MSIVNELIMMMNNKGWSQAQAARGIGVSTAVINQFLQNKYNGDVNAVEEKVRQFILREQERDKSRRIKPVYVDTLMARKGRDVIRMAHMDSDINVIYGDAGMGKTMIVRQYAKEHLDAVLIEADPGYTARVVLEELCNKLGLSKRGNMHELSESIIQNLRDSGRIILVDEAENLPYRALETLRRIHDKSGVGIVLVGMPRLILNLKGKRGEYKQLYSRVGFALRMGESLPEDDITNMITTMLPEASEPEVLNALYKACKGNARRLFKFLRGISNGSQISGQPIDVQMVHEFSEMLIN
ncbi:MULTISPECIES: AAA family ATPase [Providencia]|uniref:AAA family ATPase n=1 Tax=Providencia TaxID=586 RepID=UPI0003E1F5E6|nr:MULTISPECIES: AAA family ATPase [Providencia]ETS98915.1 AAA domain protein [Providencia alcalifaciens PAL-3]ETT05576.1 AAA domain protein [Providencia alcalifaciens F90-2004]EUC99448.1 AAA domain protein [Providencia alcalifaciens PAL-1]MTC21296.1 AAA family ATPase [Providencia sp. wls1938]MTC22169.1 AAA family ATPase [Providencia sp. wls1938]